MYVVKGTHHKAVARQLKLVDRKIITPEHRNLSQSSFCETRPGLNFLGY